MFKKDSNTNAVKKIAERVAKRKSQEPISLILYFLCLYYVIVRRRFLLKKKLTKCSGKLKELSLVKRYINIS